MHNVYLKSITFKWVFLSLLSICFKAVSGYPWCLLLFLKLQETNPEGDHTIATANKIEEAKSGTKGLFKVSAAADITMGRKVAGKPLMKVKRPIAASKWQIPRREITEAATHTPVPRLFGPKIPVFCGFFLDGI